MILGCILGGWVLWSLVQFVIMYKLDPPTNSSDLGAWFMVSLVFGPFVPIISAVFAIADWRSKREPKPKKTFEQKLIVRVLNGITFVNRKKKSDG